MLAFQESSHPLREHESWTTLCPWRTYTHSEVLSDSTEWIDADDGLEAPERLRPRSWAVGVRAQRRSEEAVELPSSRDERLLSMSKDERRL